MSHVSEWNRLFRKVLIGPAIGGDVRKPSKSEVDEWERTNSVSLPPSYKAFVQLFGPGELGGFFSIYAPCQPGGSADLTRFRSLVRETDHIHTAAVGSAEFVRTMIPFACTLGGDIFVWNKHVKSDDEGLSVFMLPFNGGKVTRVADGFRRFVERVCLGADGRKVLDDPAWVPEFTFAPYGCPRAKGRRTKSKP